MSGRSSNGSGHRHSTRDRYHQDERHHRRDRHHSERQRDENDRYDGYRRERRVPGHVTDPYREPEAEIKRGQIESVERYRRNSYDRSSRKAKDALASSAQPYTVTSNQQAYFPRSHVNYGSTATSRRRRLPVNPSMLAAFAGLVGVGVVIAAIVVAEWQILTVPKSGGITIIKTGLFRFCTYENSATTCGTIDNLSQIGGLGFLTDLEQATRGLIIIAAIIGFAGFVVNVVFGLHHFQRRRSAFYSGALYLLAGICGVSAMACFSLVLSNNISQSVNSTVTFAGLSFYLGWCGVSLLVIAAAVCFLSHVTTWAKK